MSASTQVNETVGRRAPSVGRMFLDRVAATPAYEAYRRPVGDKWESMTWGETGARVEAIAAGLASSRTMKVRRRAVEALHQDLLDEMYAPQG